MTVRWPSRIAGRPRKNAGVAIDVVANDEDADASDVLSVSSVSVVSMTADATGASIGLSSASVGFQGGRVTFDPGSDFDFLAEGESATVVINYRMSDDDADPLSDTASLTLKVVGTNDQPEARPDTATTVENGVVFG